MNLSLSQASTKFNIPRRRLQSLCRSGKIPGAFKARGIWMIPETYGAATFGSSDFFSEDAALTVKELCRVLSISEGTAKNWLRLGKIHAGADGKFDPIYVAELKARLAREDSLTLKRRRNKKNVSGSRLYQGYILNSENVKVIEDFAASDLGTAIQMGGIDVLGEALVAFAYEMFLQAKSLDEMFWQAKSLDGSNRVFDLLAEGLPGANILDSGKLSPSDFQKEVLEYAQEIKFVPGEDTLGFIYLSLRGLRDRKISGSYFTPGAVADKLIGELCQTADLSAKTICDPCCGTGMFLMKLALLGIPFENLYGHDLDEISIRLARINMYLLWLSNGGRGNVGNGGEGLDSTAGVLGKGGDDFISTDEKTMLAFLYSHFTTEDSLLYCHAQKYHVLIGNPPWGSSLSREYLVSLTDSLETAKAKGCESSALFLEKALKTLPAGGLLVYVLPESILSVACHRDIRRIMVKNASFKFVHYLENAFPGVQCPAIILGLEKSSVGSTAGCRVYRSGSYLIQEDRHMTCDSFSFNMDDREYLAIKAIESVPCSKYLGGNSTFGLGIVTGDNGKLVTSVKVKGWEPVLRGSNVFRYSLTNSGQYVSFQPEKFQQVAPEAVYRAKEKLVYRFICRVPVFALDYSQTLSLNSCNVLIPRIEGLDIKYVLAVLNSSVAAFYLGKKYNSVKLLRSHIESLPIPVPSLKEQRTIINLVEEIMACEGSHKLDLYRKLDRVIGELYGLDEAQMEPVKGYAQGGNMFLGER